MAAKSEFTLKQSPVLVQSFAGCGVQLNQHVFAQQTIDMVPQASSDDLKAKIKALAPHFVRIFYNNDQDGVPFDESLPPSPVNRRQGPLQKNRWGSFVDVVNFAQDIGATINITWQGGSLANDDLQKTAAARFANVLEILVKGGATNLRWVTIANEPNTVPGKGKPRNITPPGLGLTYRKLDKQLTRKGLRKQILFMGGDLIEGSRDPNSPFNQAKWFEHIAKKMPGVFDSLSAHVYWFYDTTGRFEQRLDDVRNILNRLANKPPNIETLQYPVPVLITEFGTRSKDFKTKGVIDPGNFHDGNKKIPLYQTNIAPFQAAWFQIRAAQMGYAGMLKWDCQFGMYDKTERAYYAIGKPDPKHPTVWQLWPMYFLLRLFTMTTAPGWKVLPVVPGAAAAGSGTKHLVAFKGSGTNLTIIGLDHRGAHLNKASRTQVSYEIDGLGARRKFELVLWNKAGGGKLHLEPTVTANAAGVVRITVPLHSVFALTTRALPAF